MSIVSKKKLAAWIAFSVILQFAVMTFLNSYFEAGTGYIRDRVVDVFTEGSDETKSDANYKVPAGATDIRVSYNGSYLSYIYHGKIEVVEIATRKVKAKLYLDNYDIDIYRWLPDRNMLIMVYRGMPDGVTDILLYTYDAEGEKEQMPIKRESKEQKNHLGDYFPSDARVVDLKMSTLTNMIYLKIECYEGTENRIYSINIMSEVARVYPPVYRIGRLELMNLSDVIYYEDPSTGSVYRHDMWGYRRVNVQGDYCILGSDMDDNLYLGHIEDGKVVEVFYGSTDDYLSNWNTIVLARPVSKDNVIITKDGQFYEIDDVKKTIYNLRTNKEFEYNGDFIGLAEGYLFYLKDNTVNRVIFPPNGV